MLLRHTAYYVLARGLPGLINFVALSVYTHVLAPGEYGRYALALAGVSLANAVLFNWIQLGLLRYFPRYAGRGEVLLSTVLIAYLGTVLATAAIGTVVYWLTPPGVWQRLVLISLALLWAQTWFELNLQMMSSRLHPLRYGAMSIVRAVCALGLGMALILAGYTAEAPALGLLCGTLLTLFLFTRADWRSVHPGLMSSSLLRELLRYGLPLTVAFVFGFVISTSDRLLIAWLIDEKATGVYSASYDLAQSTVGILTAIVSQAAYPLTVRALESEGVDTARRLLGNQGLLMLALAAPASAGMAVLSDNIASVVLGPEFGASAATLIPCVALAALMSGLLSGYYYHAFHLARNTAGQVKVAGIAAAGNLALNLIWIPQHGMLGAAWATVAAYALALVLSIRVGQHYFPLPVLPTGSVRVLAATILMVVALWPLRELRGIYSLVGSGVLAIVVYAVGLVLFKVGNCREFSLRQARKVVAVGAYK
jgi:O-antigen/teichoic acid export membrane protein